MRDIIGPYQFSARQLEKMARVYALPTGNREKNLRQKSKTFVVDEYIKMVELGVLYSDDRVELIDGVIIKMAPTGRPHGRRTHRIARMFGSIVPEDVEISIQSTIQLNDHSAPEPDIALLNRRASLDEENIPRAEDILLVVEVAESSLRSDRGPKARRYAQSGIPELWIFILADGEIEVSRQPTPQGYADIRRYRPGDTLTIQALPEIRLTVDQLLG